MSRERTDDQPRLFAPGHQSIDLRRLKAFLGNTGFPVVHASSSSPLVLNHYEAVWRKDKLTPAE